MSDPVKTEPYVSKIDRRTAMLWLGGAVAAVGAAGLAGCDDKQNVKVPSAKGYGTDPNLQNPVVPWPKLMTKAELQATALITDFILPAATDAPSASSLGVPDFIDEWISAPYPDQMKDRDIIRNGLKWVEDESQKRFSKSLFDAAPTDRDALLQSLTAKQDAGPMKDPHHFFRRLRSLTISAYYTTPAGFKEIGYIGNVPRAVDPGPSDEVKAVLEARMKTLGI